MATATSGRDDAGTGGETPPVRPRMRASDADRHATVAALQDAVARGLLGFDEGSERMAAAWSSRHLDELPPLTADLPPRAPAPTPAAGWRALWAMAAAQLQATLAGVPVGGARASRARLAVAAALVGLLLVFVLLGAATAHAVLAGPHHFHGR